MIKKLKGSALITALMVTIIVSIVASGLIFVATQQQRLVSTNLTNDRLFYAAEAGLSKAILRTQLMDMEQFTDPSEDDIVTVNNITNFEMNNAIVDVFASWNDSLNSWTLWAVASDNNSSKKCEVRLANIKHKTYVDKAFGVQNDMPYSVRFVGAKLVQGVYQPNEMMLGKMYFGGRMNIERDPIFEGEVTSGSESKSVRSANTVTAYDANQNPSGLTEAQRAMLNSKFGYGIWDLTETSESASNMRSRYPQVFPQDYKQNAGTIDNTADVVATFDDILNPSTRPQTIKGDPYVVNVGPTSDVNVIIEEGWITVNPKPSGWATAKVKFDNTRNAILFDGEKTATNRVSIGSSSKESVISGDLTVMSRNVDIEILNDVKYKELVAPYNEAIAPYGSTPFKWAINSNSATEARNGENIKSLAKKLLNNNALSKFGCVSENGNIWLGKENCAALADIRGVTMLNGAFYAPNGKFGIRQPRIKNADGTYSDGIDQGAVKFGSLENWHAGSGNEVLTRVVVIGSALMKSAGKFRQIKGELDDASIGSPAIPAHKVWKKIKDKKYKQEQVDIIPPPNPPSYWTAPVLDKFGNVITPPREVFYPTKKWVNIIPLQVIQEEQWDSVLVAAVPAVPAGTTRYTATRGFEGAFCNDYRFTLGGMFPAIFLPFKLSDQYQYNSEVTRWSCTFY